MTKQQTILSPVPTNLHKSTSFVLGPSLSLMHDQPSCNLRGSKVINRDWVNNSTCRVSHYIYIISNTFVTHDDFSELIRVTQPKIYRIGSKVNQFIYTLVCNYMPDIRIQAKAVHQIFCSQGCSFTKCLCVNKGNTPTDNFFFRNRCKS